MFFRKNWVFISKHTHTAINKWICCQFGSTFLDFYLDLFLSLAKARFPGLPCKRGCLTEALIYVRKGRINLYQIRPQRFQLPLGLLL